MWCLLSAPLLIGCDLEQLDAFTIGLLSNDEVLAVDQDALGKQAVRVAAIGQVDVFAKDLEDGSKALGFFNRGNNVAKINFNKLNYIGLSGVWHVRDLWRQTDLPAVKSALRLTVQPHGVVLLKLKSVNSDEQNQN
jgi:alpha-galactosidase